MFDAMYGCGSMNRVLCFGIFVTSDAALEGYVDELILTYKFFTELFMTEN